MSSTNKTANYELSQFVGTDIPSILNDYNGDMRKIDSAIKNASVAGGDNATAIAELQSTTARMNTEIGGINSTVNTLGGKVVAIEEIIPATASAQNKLLTAQELPEIPSITELESDVAELQDNVSGIELYIPANASENNKLATHDDIAGASGIGVLVDYITQSGDTLTAITNKFRTAINNALNGKTDIEKQSIKNRLCVSCGEAQYGDLMRFTGELNTDNTSNSNFYFSVSDVNPYADEIIIGTLVISSNGSSYDRFILKNISNTGVVTDEINYDSSDNITANREWKLAIL